MDELQDNLGFENIGTGFQRTNNSGSFTHIGYVRGGFRTVPSSSDIAKIHLSRLDEGQIIYALSESQTYIISKTLGNGFNTISTQSYKEFYFPDSGSSGGIGFPYSGSDDQFGTPAQAIITGSLFVSGSGFITASKILTTKLRAVGGGANGIAGGGYNIETQWLNAGAVYSSHLESFNNTNVCGDLTVSGSANIDTNLTVEGNLDVINNLDIGGTLSFDGFTFSDGNLSILSGSNIFGTSSLNTHQFTGSLLLTGSTNIVGNINVSGDTVIGGNTTIAGSTQITGELDVLGGLLINGNPLDFSGIEDQEIFVAHIMINTGDFQTYNGDVVQGGSPLGGNLNNQFAISSSETPAVQLVSGDKVRIDWVYNDVSQSHTTHIFTVKETDSSGQLAFPFQSYNQTFNWLSSYESDNPSSTPPYELNYTGYEYAANSSMSLHTGITASHWKDIVSQSTLDIFSFFASQFHEDLFNDGVINQSAWQFQHGTPHIMQTFKIYKIIPGIPCCDPFGDSFYHGDVNVVGGINTTGPVKIDKDLDVKGLTVRLPDNPNFHNPDKYNKDRDLEIPITKILSGGIEPIRVNDQGIFKMHNFTGDYEPVPQEGGIMFRNGEMYLGKE